MSEITVVVPTRGGARRLPVLLRALRAQTGVDLDVIVVVDGDIDGTEQALRAERELPLRVIVFDQNRGRSAALNAGFGAAEADLVLRCDDDFAPGPRHVATHRDAHRQGVRGVVGLPINSTSDSAYWRAYGLDADARFAAQAHALSADQRWRIWGGNTSLPRDLFVQLGGFDERYEGYGWEDLDLGYRIQQAGVPIDLVDEAAVVHHLASVDTRSRSARAYASGTARARFEQLHGPGTTGVPGPPSAWSRAVGSLARTLTPARTQVLAGAVDRALPVLPRPVARKAVALVVESAGQAGFVGGIPDGRR